MKLAAALLATALTGCFIQQPAGSNPGYSSGGGGGTSSGGGGGDPYAGGSADGTGGGTAAPAGPVYVEIRSACPDTVKVFYGSDPMYGSGTHSSIESNSVQSESFQPGDMFWITDDSDHGIASVTISASTRQIEVDASCGSLHEN